MQSVDAHLFVQVVVVDLDGAIEGAGHACGDVLIACTFEQGPEFQPVSVSGVELDAGDRVPDGSVCCGTDDGAMQFRLAASE